MVQPKPTLYGIGESVNLFKIPKSAQESDKRLEGFIGRVIKVEGDSVSQALYDVKVGPPNNKRVIKNVPHDHLRPVAIK